MMKKIFLLAVPILFLVGCTMANTPTAKVEELLMKYQKLDNDISGGIDSVIAEQNLTDDHQERYRKLLEKQYKNLSYEVKNEAIDGTNATVTVEIEVLDYRKVVADLTFDSTIYTKDSFDEEKLNRLESVSDKVTYTLELSLTKDVDGIWHLNALTNEQTKKLEGMY